MPPWKGENPLAWEIQAISGEILDQYLGEYCSQYIWRLLQAIKAIDAAEARTEFTIQKFCFELQQHRRSMEKLFSPTPLYLGGHYSTQSTEILDELESAGVLKTRESRLDNVDAGVYEINEKFEDHIKVPHTWEDVFSKFRKKYPLKNFFDEHDDAIVNWITDPDYYIATDRVLFEQARKGDLDVNAEIIEQNIPLSVSEKPGKIIDVPDQYQHFASTAYYLIENFKEIPGNVSDSQDRAQLKRSQRMFNVEHLWNQYEAGEDGVLGEVVLFIGYKDVRDSFSSSDNDWWLRQEPISDRTIRINCRGIEVPEKNIVENSVAVLGIVDEVGDEPAVRALAVIKSDELHKDIIDKQEMERQRNIDDATGDLGDKLDTVISQNDRLASALEEQIESEQFKESERSKLRSLVDSLRGAVDDSRRLEHVAKFMNENPELVWVIKLACNYIS